MAQVLNGGAGTDTLTGTNPGDPANPDGVDIINGLAGDDTLLGLGGDDIIQGGLGADIMDGGAGYDTLTYADATGAHTVHRPSDVPEASREWVRVDSLSLSPDQRPADGQVYVADLRERPADSRAARLVNWATWRWKRGCTLTTRTSSGTPERSSDSR